MTEQSDKRPLHQNCTRKSVLGESKGVFFSKEPLCFYPTQSYEGIFGCHETTLPRTHRGVLLTPLTIWHGQVKLKVSVLYSND